MNFNPFTIIKLFLGLFICIGLGLTIFMIVQNIKVTGAYIVSGLIIIFPAIILYGLTNGFRISERTLEKRAQRQESVTFDQNGITYKLPFLNLTQFIKWQTIETIIYTNYHSDDNAKFTFYLTQAPVQTMSKKSRFSSNIISFFTKNLKEIIIHEDCINFLEIPKMLKMHLVNVAPVDVTESYGKGSLISSKTIINNNSIKVEEYWKPNYNFESEKIIYDRYNRTFEQIKHKP